MVIKIMKLYKYRPLNNIGHVLDIILNNRFYCAEWHELNDPMEAYCEASAKDARSKREIAEKLKKQLTDYRIVSFGKSYDNYLLWSYYAAGHKGVAIEVDDPDDLILNVKPVKYDWVISMVDNEQIEKSNVTPWLLEYKREEWVHEEEYRIISRMTDLIVEKDKDGKGNVFYNLPSPCSIKNVYTGCLCDHGKIQDLKEAIQDKRRDVKFSPMVLIDGELKCNKV